jgi:HAD superfamily hydrolase (TIGR01509 family)
LPFEDPKLLILDCDGVLIDSEVISADTLIELLAEYDINIDRAFVRQNFLGRSFPTVKGRVQEHFDILLPERFEADYRARLLARFETDLRLMDGVETMLDTLAIPYCVATSSSPIRVARSLALTGVFARFEGRIFTASEVARGKPAPDLFLHAAARLGVAPEECLVIEDSSVGLQAALSAGMQAIWFTGGTHMAAARHLAIEVPGFPQGPHHRIDNFAALFDQVPALRQPQGGQA